MFFCSLGCGGEQSFLASVLGQALILFWQKFNFSTEFSANTGSVNNQNGLLRNLQIHLFIEHLLVPCSVPGTGNAETRHTVLLGSQDLASVGACQVTGGRAQHYRCCEEGSLGSNGRLQVDSPPGPRGWGILMTGMWLFLRRIPLNSSHYSLPFFYASESSCRILAQELF